MDRRTFLVYLSIFPSILKAKMQIFDIPSEGDIILAESMDSEINYEKNTFNIRRDTFLRDFLKEEGTNKSLYLANVHTNEKERVVFKKGDSYQEDGLKNLNYLLRDFRENKLIDMDPFLYDSLYALKEKLKYKGPIKVLSGYRTKRTNNMLRRRGRHTARRSMHIKGKAVDIVMPGISTRKIALKARQMKIGGVGEYRRGGFIHIDTGRVRYWRG
jgi:uncharacterized protein YcbK (DUF882 family)